LTAFQVVGLALALGALVTGQALGARDHAGRLPKHL